MKIFFTKFCLPSITIVFLFATTITNALDTSSDSGGIYIDHFYFQMEGLSARNLNLHLDDSSTLASADTITTSGFILKNLVLNCAQGAGQNLFSPQRIIEGCSDEGNITADQLEILEQQESNQLNLLNALITSPLAAINQLSRNLNQKNFKNFANFKFNIKNQDYRIDIKTAKGNLRIEGRLWVTGNVILFQILQARLGLLNVKNILLSEIKKKEPDYPIIVNKDIVEIYL